MAIEGFKQRLILRGLLHFRYRTHEYLCSEERIDFARRHACYPFVQGEALLQQRLDNWLHGSH